MPSRSSVLGRTNPAECLGNNPNIVPGSLVDETTDGPIVEGEPQLDEVKYGVVTSRVTAPTGPAELYVNGVALPNTPVVPVA